MAQSKERGFFGDVVVIHDRGRAGLPPPLTKKWRLCSTSDCKEMALDRNGEEFFCTGHIPKAGA